MDGWGGMKAGAVRDICRIHPFRKHRHDKIHFLSASHSFIFFPLFFSFFSSSTSCFFSFLFFISFFFLSLSLSQECSSYENALYFLLQEKSSMQHSFLPRGDAFQILDSVHYETITITARVSLRSVQLRMLSPCSRALI